MNAIETRGLGKRYRRTWAVRDCDLTVPAGQVTALPAQRASPERLPGGKRYDRR
jgi:hypothetical protein